MRTSLCCRLAVSLSLLENETIKPILWNSYLKQQWSSCNCYGRNQIQVMPMMLSHLYSRTYCLSLVPKFFAVTVLGYMIFPWGPGYGFFSVEKVVKAFIAMSAATASLIHDNFVCPYLGGCKCIETIRRINIWNLEQCPLYYTLSVYISFTA